MTETMFKRVVLLVLLINTVYLATAAENAEAPGKIFESLKKIEIWSLKNTVKSTQGWQKCWGADGWQQSASMESADCVT